MSKKYVVLGAGMVGSAIARDLAGDADSVVKVADVNATALRSLEADGIETMQADLMAPDKIREAIEDAAVAVNAVPGFMGFATLREVILAGVDVVDIAFMPEDTLVLDELAKGKKVTALVDFGVAPGLSHVLSGHAAAQLAQPDKLFIAVGGLPRKRSWPWEYKAPFSPVDVLEEYTRPARLVEHGREVERPALSELERIDLPGVGTLEAFNTDGLRTLLHTLDIPFMREKTLRYPGYVEKLLVLRETGLLSQERVKVGDLLVSPFELTAQLLMDAWRLGPEEEEFTVMRVEVSGRTADDQCKTYTYDLYDEFDPATSTSSMARTTGFPAAIATRMIAKGQFKKHGVVPPEILGQDPKAFEALMEGLAARNISVAKTVATNQVRR